MMSFYQKFSLTLFTTALLAFGGFCDSLFAEENAQAPPNIEHYGLLPQYREVTLSPDGKHLTFIGEDKSGSNVWLARMRFD